MIFKSSYPKKNKNKNRNGTYMILFSKYIALRMPTSMLFQAIISIIKLLLS
jgi:hypothetical protein